MKKLEFVTALRAKMLKAVEGSKDDRAEKVCLYLADTLAEELLDINEHVSEFYIEDLTGLDEKYLVGLVHYELNHLDSLKGAH